MEGGTALAETLFGLVNPSAKLTETFIEKLMDCPAHSIGEFGKEDCVDYKEGIRVGYRHYDTEDTKVAFCFGHGLSYSEFSYDKLKVEKEVKSKNGKQEITLTVTCKITNKSEIEGKEIVQLYVAPKNPSVFRPKHELKGFEKITLKPKEHKTISFELMNKDFSYYNSAKKMFDFDPGIYEIQIGSSSRDIKHCENVEI